MEAIFDVKRYLMMVVGGRGQPGNEGGGWLLSEANSSVGSVRKHSSVTVEKINSADSCCTATHS